MLWILSNSTTTGYRRRLLLGAWLPNVLHYGGQNETKNNVNENLNNI